MKVGSESSCKHMSHVSSLDYLDNEVYLTVTNTNEETVTLGAGCRFAQMVLDKTYHANSCIIVPPIDQQARGPSGSTG